LTHDIRTLDSDDDLIRAGNVFRAAMIGFPPLDAAQRELVGKLVEPGRTLGAFVDGALVATADSAGGTLTLPGGARVGHAAVTHVGVLPSHTRRGLATALLEHQLRDIAARGEVVASLRASEATIYERFGYAVASSSIRVELLTARAALRPGVGPGGPVRLLDAGEVWDVLPRIYRAHRPARPGTIDRTAVWWQGQRLRAEAAPGARYVAVHGAPGAETGFVRYHPVDTEAWFVSGERTVVVDDLFAPNEDAYLGLVRFLLDLDLVDKLVFGMLALDDPLPWLLLDRRAARVTGTRDETWLRVLDAAAVLAARTYAGTGTVTIAVNDPLLARNSATFTVTGDGAERTSGTPQLHVGIAGLGAVLLGGASWRELALAGLVRVEDASAVAVADALFHVAEAPFSGIYF
jgi:predicted acetyltransferase